jgi:16S rRNA (uracil1498-N3)-methyltransferase
MNRFFVNPQAIKVQTVLFPEDVSHQILHVLRLHTDDQVEVLDNTGLIYLVGLKIDPESRIVNGIILSSQKADTEPDVTVDLYFGMTSRDKMEWILQKGTEIGVSSFQPFISSRTLVQKVDLSPKRQARWERIIREAAEQSHRGKLPVLSSLQKYRDSLATVDYDAQLSLIAWEGFDPGERELKSRLETFSGASIALFVGPEGGFSEEEIDQARSAGCQVVSLGRRILRMETAAIVFPALVLFSLNKD